MYKQGDLVLVPVPFSDLSSNKSRPVIVVSNSSYNRKTEDIVVVAMTSVLKDEDYSVSMTSNSMEDGKLPLPSRVKCDKIYLLHSKLVQKKFGTVKSEKYVEIQNQILSLVKKENGAIF